MDDPRPTVPVLADRRNDARYRTQAGVLHYEEKHRQTWRRRFASWQEQRRVRQAHYAVRASGTILDLPCGVGRMQPVLRDHARCVVAGDVSAGMVQRCLANEQGAAPIHGVALHGAVMDASALALAAGAVDGVVAIRLLPHLTDPTLRKQAFRELARVARRFLVISYLDAASAKLRAGARKQSRRDSPTRRWITTRDEVASELAAVGFDLVEVYPLSSRFSGQVVGAFTRRKD